MRLLGRSKRGFTLVELMVVVAVLGIMVGIAVPAYRGYIARSRQAEAKAVLSAMYEAEQGFFALNGTYTACQFQIGSWTDNDTAPDLYTAGTTPGKIYYYSGFSAAPASACGNTGTNTCLAYVYNDHVVAQSCADNAPHIRRNPNSKVSSGYTAANIAADCYVAQVTKLGFILQACGNISQESISDLWTVDQNKQIVNAITGL